jgi:hypothetical protein
MTEQGAEVLRRDYPPWKVTPNAWGMVYEDTTDGALVRREFAKCFEAAQQKARARSIFHKLTSLPSTGCDGAD